ncbi:glycine cleavage system H protein, mitochondrial-like [Danaus plexippus]|uniref:glycine cleavage system H protein, mitochondrial-like n=1 Tax=Danaus plexippus TaxID=13037 RepID=UPI002AB24554|nr:glycine cleavage system H protein, mitochondrial-like [Danaus plexippus]XP_061378148.1 glycine cleavage system H protein, mitochondrial-like [Danaus plexippus]XP_061378149.1 glycine cleavage system H protein, mitochondrial-like [Danaus plexippus]
MLRQRCLVQLTKQCISRQSLLKKNVNLTYCELQYRYNSDAKERKFTDRHEWVVVKENIGTVGISNYAQESLGDVVFAQLPDVGTEVKAGDECGALESVKAASEIYSPVSGTVTAKNRDVENKPGLINTSCYEKGWLFRLKLSKPEELKDLMTDTQYETFLKTDVEKDH